MAQLWRENVEMCAWACEVREHQSSPAEVFRDQLLTVGSVRATALSAASSRPTHGVRQCAVVGRKCYDRTLELVVFSAKLGRAQRGGDGFQLKRRRTSDALQSSQAVLESPGLVSSESCVWQQIPDLCHEEFDE